MAELADAQRSGRCLRDQVQVRILLGAFFCCLNQYRQLANVEKSTFFFLKKSCETVKKDALVHVWYTFSQK